MRGVNCLRRRYSQRPANMCKNPQKTDEFFAHPRNRYHFGERATEDTCPSEAIGALKRQGLEQSENGKPHADLSKLY